MIHFIQVPALAGGFTQGHLSWNNERFAPFQRPSEPQEANLGALRRVVWSLLQGLEHTGSSLRASFYTGLSLQKIFKNICMLI